MYIVACPVGDLDRCSYQEWVVRLPIRLHGWGLRSLKETCGPAYVGALETAILYMAAGDKLCFLKEADWGGEECWGEAAEPSNRWPGHGSKEISSALPGFSVCQVEEKH